MTVNLETARWHYDGNGSTTDFSFTAKIFEADDLTVILVASDGTPTVQVEGTDYTVSGLEDESGGTVSFTTAPASGEKVAILRAQELTQDTDIKNQGAFYPEVHEDRFDRLAIVDVQQQDQIERSIKQPDEEAPLDMALPNVSGRKNQYLVFDEFGKPSVSEGSGTDTALRGDLASTASGKGDALIAGKRTLASAVAFTIHDYHEGRVVIPEIDFGATGDGVANDTTAIQAALDSGEKAIWLRGTYLVDPLTLSANDTMIYGPGKLKANSSASSLLSISGDGNTIKDIQAEGDGTYEQSSAIANGSRVALIKITGNYCSVRSCYLKEAKQNFVHFDLCTGGEAVGNLIEGGPLSMTDTAYQGIRVTNATGVGVSDNTIIANGSGGKVVQGIVLATFSTIVKDSIVSSNRVIAAYDHGIYAIICENCAFHGNETLTDGSGIVVTCADISTGSKQSNTVTGNTIRATAAAAAVSGRPGLFLRDCNSLAAHGNVVYDFPVGIQISPNQYNTINNTISDNTIVGNTVINWTDYGIFMSKVGKTVGEFARNVIANNTLVCDTANVIAAGVGIYAVIGQESSVDISYDNKIIGNVINGGGDGGIYTDWATSIEIGSNTIINPCESGSATVFAGIRARTITDGNIHDNHIEDTNGTAKMKSGIDGENLVTNTRIINNRVKGWDTATPPLRRLQQASHQNTFMGNKTGDNALTGTVTLGAAANTTVNNDNVNFGLGYTSYVRLAPINASAGTLIGSTKSPYVAIANHVNGTSFRIDTADGAAAAGTEQFFYEIVQ